MINADPATTLILTATRADLIESTARFNVELPQLFDSYCNPVPANYSITPHPNRSNLTHHLANGNTTGDCMVHQNGKIITGASVKMKIFSVMR